LERRTLRKGAEAAHQAIIDALDKGPMPAEQAGQVATALGRATLARPPVLTGNALTDATNSLSRSIQEPITAMRRRLGEPIGQAYENLKNLPAGPIDPTKAAELAQAAQGIQDRMIAAYPKAKPIFDRIKRFGGAGGLEDAEHGEWIRRGSAIPSAEELKLQNYSPAQAEKIINKAKEMQPPSLDDLRIWRQQVNTMLRSAKGGDVHALAGLQQAIDQQLMPYLPAGISRDRELYRGFMQRFPWQDINKINRLGTPRELAKYAFDGTPERAKEIIGGSTAEGKQALAEALVDHALSAVNPDAPLDQQTAQVQKALSPYIADKTAAQLFGEGGADRLREVFYAPVHRAQMAKILSQPEQHDVFVKETMTAMRGMKPSEIEAIDHGFEKLVQSLPAPERARFTQPAVPGAEMPALPSTEQALTSGLEPGPSKIAGRMGRRAEFTGPYALGRAATGSPAFAIANLLAMAGIATTSAGYRAIMENGGAGYLARLYASPTGKVAARRTIEMLAGIATQSIREATREDSPSGGEWKVEVPPK
jgi:hypothetical protein